jgi:hypothetical protein
MVTRPYAHKVARVTISGDCFTSAEEWSTGFYLGGETGDSASVTGSAANIAPYWTTFFTSATTKVSNRYRTLMVKVASFGTDGKTIDDEIDYYSYPTPILGAYTVNHNPPQISLAATLTSSEARGLASKGRMYLPGVGPSVDTNGRIPSADSGNIATNLKTFFDALNSSFPMPGLVILASHGHRTEVLPGPDIVYTSPENKFVHGLKVGDVYDTQRRRRNGLSESYTSRTLA